MTREQLVAEYQAHHEALEAAYIEADAAELKAQERIKQLDAEAARLEAAWARDGIEDWEVGLC